MSKCVVRTTIDHPTFPAAKRIDYAIITNGWMSYNWNVSDISGIGEFCITFSFDEWTEDGMQYLYYPTRYISPDYDDYHFIFLEKSRLSATGYYLWAQRHYNYTEAYGTNVAVSPNTKYTLRYCNDTTTGLDIYLNDILIYHNNNYESPMDTSFYVNYRKSGNYQPISYYDILIKEWNYQRWNYRNFLPYWNTNLSRTIFLESSALDYFNYASNFTATAGPLSEGKYTVASDTARLPSSYQEVEYLQSSGTQYIDTSYIFTNSSVSEYGIEVYSKSSNGSSMFGTQYYISGNKYSGVPYTTAGNTTLYLGSDIVSAAMKSFIKDQWNTYVLKTTSSTNGSVKLNDESETSFTYSGGINNYSSIYLFAVHKSTGAAEKSSMKCKSFYMKDNGVLVRNMIPCYRKSDGVGGMYDLVNDQFYTNAGTGTFILGPDVFTGGKYKINNQ